MAQVVHIPYVVDQQEGGGWRACALLRPGAGATGAGATGAGATGDGATPQEALTDLRTALESLLEIAGPPSELTVTVSIA